MEMTKWIAALSVASLAAAVPLIWILRILYSLPAPMVLSHRQWPIWMNVSLIGGITVPVMLFIRKAYFMRSVEPLEIGIHFVAVSLIYLFGLVLLLRQFVGLYPDYLVSAGRMGLAIRKSVYQKIVNVQIYREGRRETSLNIRLENGERVRIDLPGDHLPVLYDRIRSSRILE